MRAETI